MIDKSTSQPTLKKLMQIIYDKQKQVDRYRKKLREKQRNKTKQHHNSDINEKLGLTCQDKQYITRQIIENKKILECTTSKLYSMEAKIQQLQADLEQEQNRNHILEQQLYIVKIENEAKDQEIKELRTVKQLLENTKLNKNGEISEKEIKIQQLIIENKKIKMLSEQTKQENIQLKERLRNIEGIVNKQIKFIHKNMRFCRKPGLSQIDLNSNCSNVSLGHLNKRSQKQIKTYAYIAEKLDQCLQDKIAETIELMKKWEQALNKREQEWRKNFQKGLAQYSIQGISGLISDSILLVEQPKNTHNSRCQNPQNQSMVQPSQSKYNEQQLLKQLQKECQKQIQQEQKVQKQKQIELEQVKQSLRMTKQINEQLFDEINKQQNIIKLFKLTFKQLEDKKLVKIDHVQTGKLLRNAIGRVF